MLKFFKKLLLISFPIILQQLFLNFASLLDTLMVGQLDEISISGVYVATQIVFVANLMIFGSIEGLSVFFSQFFGKKDDKHLKNTFAYKFVYSIIAAIFEIIIIAAFGKNLVSLFVKTNQEIQVALDYLYIVIFSIVPFAISVTIASTLREIHHPVSPMVITAIGIIMNFFFNYLFIFGKLGFPTLGASGAAIGTLINRLVEMILLVIVVIVKKYPFSQNFIHSFKIEKELSKRILLKSIPLFLNETLWSLTQIILVFFFTKCDSIATSVLPIVQTIFNLLFVVLLGLGNGVSIVVGNTIGESKYEEAQKQAYYSLILTIASCLILGAFLASCSSLITGLYKGVGEEAKKIASRLIRFSSIYLLINGVNTSLFFLLRGGGKTGVVFFFDSFYGWVVSIPLAFVLSSCTNISFINMYIVVYLSDSLKMIVGFILLVSKKWYKNLTSVNNNQELNNI